MNKQKNLKDLNNFEKVLIGLISALAVAFICGAAISYTSYTNKRGVSDEVLWLHGEVSKYEIVCESIEKLENINKKHTTFTTYAYTTEGTKTIWERVYDLQKEYNVCSYSFVPLPWKINNENEDTTITFYPNFDSNVYINSVCGYSPSTEYYVCENEDSTDTLDLE